MPLLRRHRQSHQDLVDPREVIDRIIQRTLQGELQWRQIGPLLYECQSDGGKVRLDVANLAYVFVLDGDGNQVPVNFSWLKSEKLYLAVTQQVRRRNRAEKATVKAQDKLDLQAAERSEAEIKLAYVPPAPDKNQVALLNSLAGMPHHPKQ